MSEDTKSKQKREGLGERLTGSRAAPDLSRTQGYGLRMCSSVRFYYGKPGRQRLEERVMETAKFLLGLAFCLD